MLGAFVWTRGVSGCIDRRMLGWPHQPSIPRARLPGLEAGLMKQTQPTNFGSGHGRSHEGGGVGSTAVSAAAPSGAAGRRGDRKSVGKGKRGAVRGDHGGGGLSKKKNKDVR